MGMNAELHDVHVQLARVNMESAGRFKLIEERLLLLHDSAHDLRKNSRDLVLHLDLLHLLVALIRDITERLDLEIGEERHFVWLLFSVDPIVSILFSQTNTMI